MDKKRDSFFLSGKKNKEKEPLKKEKQEFKKQRQEEFNKSRNGLEKVEKEGKKPFDKKTYRLKKYSKKYKLEQWQEQRKKKLLRNYYKDVKKDETPGSYKPITFDQDTTDSNQQVGRFVRHPDLIEKENAAKSQEVQSKNKKDRFTQAKERYDKIKQEKLQKRLEIEKAREEKAQKLQEYKKKKQEKFKKLSKKTKKGQPVMTGRLELLLEKIQKS